MAVAVNAALAKGYADAVARIAEALGLENGLTARDVARFPDVLSVEDDCQSGRTDSHGRA